MREHYGGMVCPVEGKDDDRALSTVRYFQRLFCECDGRVGWYRLELR